MGKRNIYYNRQISSITISPKNEMSCFTSIFRRKYKVMLESIVIQYVFDLHSISNDLRRFRLFNIFTELIPRIRPSFQIYKLFL